MHCLKFTLWRWRNIPGTNDGQFLVIRKDKHICGVLKPWTNLVENSSEICCIKWDNFGVMARLVVLGKPGISLDRMEMKEANFWENPWGQRNTVSISQKQNSDQYLKIDLIFWLKPSDSWAFRWHGSWPHMSNELTHLYHQCSAHVKFSFTGWLLSISV